ncbi:MAG: hypothetical protein QM817_08555 [Archangium sp.]
MRARGLLFLLLLPGCVATWRRTEVETRILREHYATTTLSSEDLKALWESLEPVIASGCLSFSKPCRVPQTEALDTFCFQWGKEHTCFKVEGTGVARIDGGKDRFTERWIYEQLDPTFKTTLETAEQKAEEEVSAEEVAPLDANSFWATAKAVVNAPLFTLGLQVQGGFRRWVEHYVVLSVGGGYERTFTSSRGFGEPRDALLFTGRFELSMFDPTAQKRLNLPPISAYVGLTGVLGVTPLPSWTTRGFVGISAVVPVSIELGYALSALPQGTLGQFYLAAGLGI